MDDIIKLQDSMSTLIFLSIIGPLIIISILFYGLKGKIKNSNLNNLKKLLHQDIPEKEFIRKEILNFEHSKNNNKQTRILLIISIPFILGMIQKMTPPIHEWFLPDRDVAQITQDK